EWTAQLAGDLAFLAEWPLQRPAVERIYEFDANWALYVDNYLEGLHIPFVHPGLVRALAFADYGYEVHAWGTLQTGRVADPGAALPLPPAPRLAGRGLGALYYWLFPATMVNVYPWGLSCNQLEPLGPARTRVRYLSAVAWPERRERGAGAGLGQVELEDQQVV